MKRWTKIPLAVLVVLLVLLVAVPAGFLLWVNGAGGHQAMERLIDKESGGVVKVTDLGGHFPDSVRVAHADIADSRGIWATVDGLALDWSPLVLLSGGASIQLLSADHVQILRLPVDDSGSSSSASSGADALDLPVRVSLDKLQITKLDLDEAVAGAPASLSITGTADIPSPARASARLSVKQLDGAGQYGIEGGYGRGGADLEITASEPAQGLLARLADLPDLGALHLAASLKGPAKDETLEMHVEAGDLRAEARGKVDLDDRRLDLDLSLAAPAMTPRPDLSWKSAKLDAHLHGRFDTPQADGHLTVEGIASAGAALDRVEAELQGKDGRLDVDARLFHLQTAGLPVSLLGAAPIGLKASARLGVTPTPIGFSLNHPLLQMTGRASLADQPDVSADIVVPDLAPFSTLAGTELHGRAVLTAKLSRGSSISVDGKVFEGDAEKLHLSADGAIGDKLDLRWSLATPDLARFGAPMAGSLAAKGTLRGLMTDFRATANAEGQLEFPGLPKGPVSLSIDAAGLPNKPSGKIEAHGQLAGAPLALSAKADRAKDGATRITIDQAHWKSADASGTVSLDPRTGMATGKLRGKMTDLGDLTPLAGMPLKGSVEAGVEMVEAGKVSRAQIHAEVTQLDWGDGRLAHAALDGTIDDPAAHPVAALKVMVEGIDASGVTGKASLQADGPTSALALKLSGTLGTPSGPADLSADAQADLDRSLLQLSALQATYSRQAIQLLAPATLAYGAQTRIEHLRLGVAKAELDIDGQAAPAFALNITLKNGDLGLVGGKGSLTAEAHLQGDPAAPSGDVHLAGHDLRWQGSPPASLEANAHLDGGMAHLDAKLESGKNASLTVTGTVPIQSYAAMDLHAAGSLDLALLDPLLAANGREARGKVTLDGGVQGSLQAPRISGGATFEGVSLRDFAQGIRFTDIKGSLETDGTAVQLTDVTGKSGPGTFSLLGRIDVTAPGMPVDLTLTGRDMRPLASDLLTADMDADLTVKGTIAEKLTVAGSVKVSRADINIPNSLPPSVATLNIQRKGAPPPPPPAPGLSLALAVTVDAPERIFVRGRGLDAEMGGKLEVGGTVDDPQVGGGFDLRQGTFALAGQTLTITKGRIGFDDSGPGGKLDPTLNITSESNSNGIDAILQVTGYADRPVIKLTSTPDLPQDEILAHLLFNSSMSQLTPLQIASIAQGVASLSGAGGGFDPLGMVRKTLGIDRLSVSNSNSGTTNSTSNTTVEAGKYVAEGVYVGTRQGMSGGTQARVQIDITRTLKFDTTLGTGGGTPATGTTIDNDPGSSVGLTYQIEY
jgi:translocation and assembly module TamB